MSMICMMLCYPSMSSWVYLDYRSPAYYFLFQADPFLPQYVYTVCQFPVWNYFTLITTYFCVCVFVSVCMYVCMSVRVSG